MSTEVCLRAKIFDEHDVDNRLVGKTDDHGAAVGKGAAHALTTPVVSRGSKTVANSHVVFHNYKGRYFLAEIWASGQDKGRELLETREEQQLAKRQEMSAVNLPLTTSGAK